MKYSEWPKGDYPVYIDPTWLEIVELASTIPDTLRILDGVDGDHFAVASGYGNTHQSVYNAARANFGNYWSCDTLILHRDTTDGSWAWNPDAIWGGMPRWINYEAIPLQYGKNRISDGLWQFVQDFIKAYEEEKTSYGT